MQAYSTDPNDALRLVPSGWSAIANQTICFFQGDTPITEFQSALSMRRSRFIGTPVASTGLDKNQEAWCRERMPAFAAFRDATERVQKLLAVSRGEE